MSPLTSAFLVGASLFSLFIFFVRRKNGPKLPPGPWALPVIGNLHMLGPLPHHNLQKLAQKYGPIMSMRLGQIPSVIVSSPDAAELILKTHDVTFASRPMSQVAKYFHYGSKGVILTKYGSYWRNVRRLSTVKLLNPVKIDALSDMRRHEVGQLVTWIKGKAASGETVDLSERVAEAVEDMTCKMVIGRSRDERFKIKEIFQEGTQLAGAFNIGEFVPYLLPFDFQGIVGRIKSTSKLFDNILDTIIDERISSNSEEEDFMGVLLSLMNTPINSHGESLDIMERNNIKAILTDLLGAAMDTSASTIEWAFSELIRHPRVMKKLQKEMDREIGSRGRVEEHDLSKLGYLDMVIKESMRLHPVVPLLIPHECMQDIAVNGYEIREKTRVIVNVFAIGRDPIAWPEKTLEFYPERFEGSEVDVQGRDFKLLPFGSGRRGCPGIRLGLIMVRLIVAQLVHCFDWELPHKEMRPLDLDMEEQFGLGVRRVNHLRLLPTYRFKS